MDRDMFISAVISEFRYDNRSVSHPEKCICYREGLPCHDMENLNCFLCYCPYYDTEKEEGGCLRDSPDGKWHDSEKLPKGRIWDCSDCDYPHREETVRAYLEAYFAQAAF